MGRLASVVLTGALLTACNDAFSPEGVSGLYNLVSVNGSAILTRDPDILAAAEVAGKRPTVAVVVRVEEAFLHCGKAMLRWQ